MQVIEVRRDSATVQVSKLELVILNNVLNEVCNGIDVPEFATRIGAELSEVRQFLNDVNNLLGHHLLKQERLP